MRTSAKRRLLRLVVVLITWLRRIWRIGGLFCENEGAGDQIMQCLFSLSKESHDVTDQKPTAETSFDHEAGSCPSDGDTGSI